MNRTAEQSEAARLRLRELVSMPCGAPIPEDVIPEVAEAIEAYRAARDSKGQPSDEVKFPAYSSECIRRQVITDLNWAIDRAKVRGDDQAVAAYAVMLVPLGVGG